MAKTTEMVEVALNKLRPYERNAKKHPQEQVEKIKNSIIEFGFLSPCLIDKDNNIIAGHGRVMAAKELNMKTVPCVFIEGLTDEQRRAYILADNRLGELGEWDMDLVFEELTDLDDFGFDIELTGFELPEEEPEADEDDYDPESDEAVSLESKVKLGDIWQLGEHRLMCGDSTDATAVGKLMDGQTADLVFTDPPYGMKKESEGVLNDNLNYDDLLEFNKQWIPLSFSVLKDNGSWYCWGIDEPLMDIYSNILKPMIKENKITFRNLLTWFKNPSGCGDGQNNPIARSYGIITEKCLFVMCGVQGFNNNQDNYYEGWEPIRQYLAGEAEKVGLTPEKLKEICGVGMWSHWFSKSQFAFITEEHYNELREYYKNDAFKKEYYTTRAYFDNTHDLMTEVWQFDRTNKDEREHTGGHATPKPIALCARGIKSSSREDELVLDLFGGSGSTLIAAEQLNRKCYMMELDPHYCDVIIDRWEEFTGNKAVLING